MNNCKKEFLLKEKILGLLADHFSSYFSSEYQEKKGPTQIIDKKNVKQAELKPQTLVELKNTKRFKCLVLQLSHLFKEAFQEYWQNIKLFYEPDLLSEKAALHQSILEKDKVNDDLNKLFTELKQKINTKTNGNKNE